jgi:FKBP-type peptidyl-prolyl cis-trans isomerase FklB
MTKGAQLLLVLALQVGLAAAGTNEVGKKYLEENAKRPGVVTLPSGLQYKVLKAGDGQEHPLAGTSCECHYAGTTPSLTPDAQDIEDENKWTEFDSSYKRGSPTSFAPNQVIKGWTEAMQLMVEGDKWEMYIPSEMGYGDGGSGAKIKGGDVLIFRMEIIKIQGQGKPADRCDPKTEKGCSEKQVKFIAKFREATSEKRKSESDRLQRMQDGGMKPEARTWIFTRLNLLTKLDEL